MGRFRVKMELYFDTPEEMKEFCTQAMQKYTVAACVVIPFVEEQDDGA